MINLEWNLHNPGIASEIVEVKKVRNCILPPQQLHSRQGTLTHIPTNDLHSSAIRTHRHTCYRWTDRPSVLVCTACKRTEHWSRDKNRPKEFSLLCNTILQLWCLVQLILAALTSAAPQNSRDPNNRVPTEGNGIINFE